MLRCSSSSGLAWRGLTHRWGHPRAPQGPARTPGSSAGRRPARGSGWPWGRACAAHVQLAAGGMRALLAQNVRCSAAPHPTLPQPTLKASSQHPADNPACARKATCAAAAVRRPHQHLPGPGGCAPQGRGQRGQRGPEHGLVKRLAGTGRQRLLHHGPQQPVAWQQGSRAAARQGSGGCGEPRPSGGFGAAQLALLPSSGLADGPWLTAGAATYPCISRHALMGSTGSWAGLCTHKGKGQECAVRASAMFQCTRRRVMRRAPTHRLLQVHTPKACCTCNGAAVALRAPRASAPAAPGSWAGPAHPP